MSDDKIRVGYKQKRLSVNGYRVLGWYIEMSHEGLNEHRIIHAPTEYILDNKISLQKSKWMDRWSEISSKVANLDEANRKTEEAVNALKAIENLLTDSLTTDSKIDWEKLKKKTPFPEPLPQKPYIQGKKNYPQKPIKEEPIFSFVENMFKVKKEHKIKEYEQRYANLLTKWEKEKAKIDEHNQQIDLTYQNQLEIWEKATQKWQEQKRIYLRRQKEFNNKIEEKKLKYQSNDPEAIYEFAEMILSNSKYPESFPNSFEIDYNPENKMLIIEYQLPSQKEIPKVKEVKYITARQELKEVFIPENQLNKIYDETIYKIALRSIHELFESDIADAINCISFNGWVESINKATGKQENNCILSIQAKKDEFSNLDLAKVDPKTCFKTLKGVASSKLSTLTPVQPILQINREDKRFVDSYQVEDKLDNSTNLAAMDWEDFEQLIRELFEKEFKANGGEVKITQASRDGGVDAVAFDPDPIRGGKIVIQAKRYTNTVGVSAVRDLFGTVLNEGAIKGILVTTSDYGSDSYTFAKGKPLTLLNGSNLLHLLERLNTMLEYVEKRNKKAQ